MNVDDEMAKIDEKLKETSVNDPYNSRELVPTRKVSYNSQEQQATLSGGSDIDCPGK